jgi:hypothetical protein
MHARHPLEVVATGLLALALGLLASSYVLGVKGLTGSHRDAQRGVQSYAAVAAQPAVDVYADVDAKRLALAARALIPVVQADARAVRKRPHRARAAVSKTSRRSAARVRAQPVSYSPPAPAPAQSTAPAAQPAPAPPVRQAPSRTAPPKAPAQPPKAPAQPPKAPAQTPVQAPVAPPVSVTPHPHGGDDNSDDSGTGSPAAPRPPGLGGSDHKGGGGDGGDGGDGGGDD